MINIKYLIILFLVLSLSYFLFSHDYLKYVNNEKNNNPFEKIDNSSDPSGVVTIKKDKLFILEIPNYINILTLIILLTLIFLLLTNVIRNHAFVYKKFMNNFLNILKRLVISDNYFFMKGEIL